LLNHGDGTFSSNDQSDKMTSTYFAGTNPDSVVVADLDGDGLPDIAAANFNADSVSVLRNKPSDPGSFEDTVAYVTGGFPTAIAADDFFHHADGKLDLITANSASNDVSIIENVGSPPDTPGPGGGGAWLGGLHNTSSGLSPADPDQIVVVPGAPNYPVPLARVEQRNAPAVFDPWYPVARRHGLDENAAFSKLLGKEIEQPV
jgi:hypothetical protein